MAHLTNPLATTAQLFRLRQSSLCSLAQDVFESVFFTAQCLTQAAGQLLDLPQSVTARANVILARFWLVDSPMAYDFSDVSAAVIYLVAKVGPIPRSPRDVSNVYAYLGCRDSVLFRTKRPGAVPDSNNSKSKSNGNSINDPHAYYQTEADYLAFQTRLVALEARILETLSFNTHVALPYALAVTYLQTLDFLSQPKATISRKTIQFLNTALLSPQMLYLTHQPHALATAAIYSAARQVGAKMPACEWWEVFDVDREELGFLVVGMGSVEACLRQRREEKPHLFERMPTKKMVEDELERRGGLLQTNNGDATRADEEGEIMKKLDCR